MTTKGGGVHFTVVLHGDETEHLVADITYEPSPIITSRGVRTSLHPEHPTLEKDDVALVLAAIKGAKRDRGIAKQAVVVVHENGHGTARDLTCLLGGLEDAGYAVSEARFSGDGTPCR